MVWNCAPGGMRSVVESYRHDGFITRQKIKLIAAYSGHGFFVRQLVLLRALLLFVATLATSKVELVHVHASMRGSFWRKSIFCVIARAFGVPVVFHLHGSELKVFYESQPAPLKRLIIAQLEAASRVLVLSPSWGRFVKGIAPKAAICVVPNYVDVPVSVPDRSRSVRKILFLGQIGQRKGVFDLIGAFAQVHASSGAVQLVICGNGALDKAKALVDQFGIAEHVDFRGWVGPAERNSLLADADIYVLPSYNEGLPMSVLEAMAWSLPVVTTPVGGLPELIEDGVNGILCEPGNVASLAAAILALIGDKDLRRRMGQAAHQSICEKFSAAAVLPLLDDVYRTVDKECGKRTDAGSARRMT